MFDSNISQVATGKLTRYSLSSDNVDLTYSDVISLWLSNSEFRLYFNELLAASPFSAFRWETPVLTTATLSNAFEFVLINEPSFCKRKTDRFTYKEKFTSNDDYAGVVCFENLSGDARLVVPSPRTDVDAYGHLATFVRLAPLQQRDTIWRVVAQHLQSSVSDTPLWLSTAGGGVAWLHIRLDSYPKYYGHESYRN